MCVSLQIDFKKIIFQRSSSNVWFQIDFKKKKTSFEDHHQMSGFKWTRTCALYGMVRSPPRTSPRAARRGKAVQVDRLQVDPALKAIGFQLLERYTPFKTVVSVYRAGRLQVDPALKAIGFKSLKGTPLSRLWFQPIKLAPLGRGSARSSTRSPRWGSRTRQGGWLVARVQTTPRGFKPPRVQTPALKARLVFFQTGS